MLSMNTIQVLANGFVNEVLSGPVPTLLVIHDGPTSHSVNHRAMTIQREPIDDLRPWRTGMPGLLSDLGDAIRTRTASPPLRLLAAAVTNPIAGLRLAAVGVHYHDVTATGTGLHAVERVDAVDIDGRVYQAVRASGGDPFIVIDGTPDPSDLPATQPGLAAILAAAG